jgi:hypothetical protein
MGALKPRNETNPFMEGFAKYVQPKKVQQKHVTGSTFTNEETGEEFDSVIIEKTSKIEDVGDFIKLKITPYAIRALSDLSPSSFKLLFWMMTKLQYHMDYVTIYGPRAQSELGYKSINSIHKAIQGLLDANIIATKEGGTWLYYINPMILYKGNILFLFLKYKKEMQKISREKELGIGAFEEPEQEIGEYAVPIYNEKDNEIRSLQREMNNIKIPMGKVEDF